MAQLSINGQSYFSDSPPDTPLLWVIREELQLTGTKFGCGIGMCGSCTVHVNGQPVRSCTVKVGDINGTVKANRHDGTVRSLSGVFDIQVQDQALRAGNAAFALDLYQRLRDAAGADVSATAHGAAA